MWDRSPFSRQAHVFLQDLDTGRQLFQFGHIRGRAYVTVENGQGHGERGHGVGDIHDPADATFAGNAREQEINLLLGVAELGQVFDAVEYSAFVSNRCVYQVGMAVGESR